MGLKKYCEDDSVTGFKMYQSGKIARDLAVKMSSAFWKNLYGDALNDRNPKPKLFQGMKKLFGDDIGIWQDVFGLNSDGLVDLEHEIGEEEAEKYFGRMIFFKD